MWSGRRNGFTLLEVLVAVAILGFVASGAIRLSTTATKTLESVREENALLDRVQALETDILTGVSPENGEDGGLKWESLPCSLPVMKGFWEVRYRELNVTMGNRSITLYIP